MERMRQKRDHDDLPQLTIIMISVVASVLVSSVIFSLIICFLMKRKSQQTEVDNSNNELSSQSNLQQFEQANQDSPDGRRRSSAGA